MSAIDYIIVGLGNPDKKYEKTRHNSGFIMMNFIADKLGVQFNKFKYNAISCEAHINAKKVLLLKPQTYMNLSGESVLSAMSFYKIKPENIILIFDDVSLPVGKIRVRKKGSHGGQNGVKNIISLCDSDNFPRIKVGVGSKPNENWDLADWVLSDFSKSEFETITKISDSVFECLKLIVDNKIDEAMNKFN